MIDTCLDVGITVDRTTEKVVVIVGPVLACKVDRDMIMMMIIGQSLAVTMALSAPSILLLLALVLAARGTLPLLSFTLNLAIPILLVVTVIITIIVVIVLSPHLLTSICVILGPSLRIPLPHSGHPAPEVVIVGMEAVWPDGYFELHRETFVDFPPYPLVVTIVLLPQVRRCQTITPVAAIQY